MPTCKDCVHVEVCRDFLTSEIGDENKKKAVQKYLSELENEMNINGCPFFKDRSKFVELPCEIGARAYVLHRSKKGGGFIQNNLTVVGIHLKDTKGCRGVPRQEYLVVRSDPLNMSTHINLKEVGKTLFFSKEEAEQALQEQHSNESVSSVNDKYNPRKPIIQKKDRTTDYILCPNCFKYSGMLVDSPRCLACGQAIDWGKKRSPNET
jgi:hypothetical protein